MNLMVGITREAFFLLEQMSPYLLFGFLFAGILKVVLPEEKIVSHLGEGNISSSVKASIMGIPLPLCSCGVIPAAVSLRRQGANKGATLSFLISTPTTGIDSILATYALLGPLFTVFRVATSFVTGVVCGIIGNLTLKQTKSCQDNTFSCTVCGEEGPHDHSVGEKIRHIFYYAFVELLDDIGKWLIIGIIIGGFISYVIPDYLISKYLGSDLKAMLLMLGIGIPIYVCATGSIPIVAALMLKGMSPGAGLVFLLAGPATNTVTITVIARELGKGAIFIYLLSISVASILGGLFLNILWPGYGNIAYISGAKVIPEWVKICSSFVLLGLILFTFARRLYPGKIYKKELHMQEGKVVIDVPEMNCQHCVKTIKDALKKIDGIEAVEADLGERRISVYSKVVPDETHIKKIISSIASAGFKAYLNAK